MKTFHSIFLKMKGATRNEKQKTQKLYWRCIGIIG